MLQNRKNKLTVSILSRLKNSMPSSEAAGSVQPFSPMGDPEDPEEDSVAKDKVSQDSVDDSEEEKPNLLQVMYPRRRKRVPGPT